LVSNLRNALVIGFGALALFSCSPYEGTGDNAPTEPLVDGQACKDPSLTPVIIKQRADRDTALRAALAKGPVDAVAVARAASKINDFRLAGIVTGKDISTMVYGAQCRLGGDFPEESLRVIGFVDYPGKPLSSAPYMAFGKAYNAALLADPRYPYGDVCRPYEPARGDRPATGPRRYGFPDLGPMPANGGLYAAARRGDIRVLRDAIAEGNPDVNHEDLFGMTPLAWAVAYRQPAAAAVLMRADASPAGAPCRSLKDGHAPIQIARQMRWRAMIRQMRPKISEEDFVALADGAHPVSGSLEDFNEVLEEMRKRYEGKDPKEKAIRHDLTISVNARGQATKCTFAPEVSAPWFNADICAQALKTLRWKPAHTSFGTPVAGEVLLNVWVRDKER